MNALIDQLTALRLHGMAACAHDLLSARKPPSLTTAIKQLIDAETVERRVRSIQYQMRIAKFPHHKDLATFDYSAAAVTQTQIEPFCSGQFTEEAHNLILVGGTGTGKTHIAIALGTTLINNGKKVRFQRQAVMELGLGNVTPIQARVEAFEPVSGGYAQVISRAFSSLGDFIALTTRLVATDGEWLAMKGPAVDDELAGLPEEIVVSQRHILAVPYQNGSRQLVVLRRRDATQA